MGGEAVVDDLVNNMKNEKLIWKTERRRISALVPYEHNPRRLTDEQAAQLTKSLEKFNLVEIPAINTDGTIIAGHQRLAIMKALGRGAESVDVRVPCRKLTEAELKEYNLRSNKNTGDWDFDTLTANFPEDMLKDVGFDLSAFPEIEVPHMEGEDDVPEMRKTDIKIGDAFALGEHILICGDSTDIETVKKLGPCEMAFTDPPYGIDYSGGRTQVIKKKEYGKIKNDNLSDLGTADLIKALPFDTQEIYICVSPVNLLPFLKRVPKYDALIVWDKGNIGLGYMAYRRQCEFIIYIRNRPFKKSDKSDVDLWSIGRDSGIEYEHGNQKPVELVERAILNSSIKGDTVLDMFGGSGSTLIACEKTKRRCRMIEIESSYCQVILDRWEAFTGMKAKPILDK